MHLSLHPVSITDIFQLAPPYQTVCPLRPPVHVNNTACLFHVIPMLLCVPPSPCSVSVVAEFNQYWVKLPGPVISQRGAPPLTTQSHTTPPVQTTTPSILPGPVSSPFICFSQTQLLLKPLMPEVEWLDSWVPGQGTDSLHSSVT